MPRCGGSVGQYERGQCAVEIIAEHYQCLVFAVRQCLYFPSMRRAFLNDHRMIASVGIHLNDFVARRLAPRPCITRESRIRGLHLHTITNGCIVHRFFQLHNRAGALQTARINLNDLPAFVGCPERYRRTR